MSDAMRDHEYAQLYPRLAAYAQDFGCEFNDQAKNDVNILANFVKLVDQLYDDLKREEDRAVFAADVLKMLKTGVASKVILANDQLYNHLSAIIAVLDRRGTRDEFSENIARIFMATEVIRTTQFIRILVVQSLFEGQCAGELIELVTRGDLVPAFAEFIPQIIAGANLVDDVVDAQDDYIRGERARRPDAAFYLWAGQALVRKGVELVRAYPEGRSFVLTSARVPSYKALVRKSLQKLTNMDL